MRAGADDGQEFVKRAAAPPGALAAEAAGLAWLAAAGGAAVCRVREVRPDALVLDRVQEVPATAAAAEAFGRDLATTHAAGADRFGAPPPGVPGDAWIASLPLSMSSAPEPWGRFYATRRVQPYLRAARDRDAVDAAGAAVVERVCQRLSEGDEALCAGGERPARLHGDLWSGNVLWSPGGAVLVDCAAHGGHPETDLAMLALFGLPHLDRVLAAYTEAAGTPQGWRARVPLHQLHPLLVHAVLFGGGYGTRAVRAAEQALAL
ncbi:fructosamine kinase family protein [Kineococcus auxinigenes]|uniref:fructosamine kinase family protein n=1 Tax=unclassified Kineococcus TaxID=2621656 RepID=UPI003D7C6AEE